MPTKAHLAATGLAGAALLLVTAAGCGSTPSQQAGTSNAQARAGAGAPGPSATPTTPPVQFKANVEDGAQKVQVDTLVAVKASQGTVSKVQVSYSWTDSKGATKKSHLSGKLNKAKTGWKATERLEPSGDYTMAMTGENVAGETTKASSSFTTQALSLSQQTYPELYPLKGSEVGVGMPAVVRFDVGVKDKASIEKNLHVTTAPQQTGSWHWYGDREVHWRPKTYWKPGTKVSVKADINGVSAGGGIYGQKSASTKFTVGRSMVVKVNLKSDVATVYKDGDQVRTIYVSAGKPGWQTRSGTKLIMAKEYNKKMTNEMIGAKEDYDLTVAYAIRITNSGEFLHSAPWNAGAFGRRNVSHGCVGMSTADAAWLIRNSMIGDPVVTTGSNRGIEPGNGFSDWNASFKEYAKGSAL